MMKINRRIYRSLATFIIILMLGSTFMLQPGIGEVQASSGNLADQAVAFLKAEYVSNGSQSDLSTHYPYVPYVLNSAGVDMSDWKHSNITLTNAVYGLVDTDINNLSVPIKYLAQDLISMQALGNTDRVNQLENLIQNRQENDGTFENDSNIYSIIAAYDMLGRAGKISLVNAGWAQSYLLGQQTASGAWTDFMTNAEAIRALKYLVPGAAADSAVGMAIANGSDWLKQQQQSDGSFQAALDDPLIDTSEAIATQKVLGLDPTVWQKDGKSAVAYFNNHALNADGSFGTGKNVMDATWALDSCNLLGITPTGAGGGGGGGEPATATVRVLVEGANSNLADTTVTVSGTALDALQQAVGSNNVVAPGGFISSISGESGHSDVVANTDTSWFYYVIRNNAIDSLSLSSAANGYNVANGDQIVFYIGAYGHTTYAPKTYFPIVNIVPQSPTAGQTLTINISAKKYDWSVGIEDLSNAEIEAIGNFTVKVGANTYTSANGQVTLSNVSAGTLSYIISNLNSGGYPNVVPYRGSIIVSGSGSGGDLSSTCTPGVAVVGMSGELLFGPAAVTVSKTNEWGVTALGALDATGLSYVMSAKWEGFVDSIAGQANNDQQGWMYTVNDTSPLVLAKDYSISSHDNIIWYFSKSMNQVAPTWAKLKAGGTGTVTTPAAVTSTNGKAAINPASGGTVGLGSEASVKIPTGALNGNVALNVAIQQVTSPPAASAGFRMLGNVFEFTVDNSATYKFSKPITLTFSFDPAALSAGETPAIYYYDVSASKWVNLGGTISGKTITVDVDHFTKFALLTKEMIKQVTPVVAPKMNFSDVTESYWASEAIHILNQRAYISGYPDGSFRPDQSISRAEFVAILNKVLQPTSTKSEAAEFIDVSSQDWFYGAVEHAVNAGLVKGYGNSFKPNTPISREELAIILINALGKTAEANSSIKEKSSFTDDTSISDWSRGFVQVAVKNGIIKGYPDNYFKPQGSATRAEACTMVKNFLVLYASIQ